MATERKERLIRVFQIMQSTDEKSPLNANEIIERLSDEFTILDVDRRAIYRDIALLQSCGYPIEQRSRKGYYMEHHTFYDWELKIMMDAIWQAKFVSHKEICSIRNKLMTLTSSRGRKRFSHIIQAVVNPSAIDKEMGQYIETMLEAMYLHKKIEFQYTEVSNDMKKVLRRNGKRYQLSLYTIYWSGNNYYLIGSHDQHEGLTHYRLDRIVNLRMLDDDMIEAREKIGVNPEVYIQEYIDMSVNHFAGELIRIKVQYKPDPITNAILYDFAGKDIRVRKVDDNVLEASFKKMHSITLSAWFMQHATRFKVVAPNKLRDAIVRDLEDACEKYGAK